MKWNWGTKIGLLYTVFVLFIIGMVYMAFNQKYDLVTEDYYEKEIAFQGTIDSKVRAENLEGNLTTGVDGPNLKIIFPQQHKLIEGTINCFRPSDESKDFTEDFKTDIGFHKIPLNKFIRGKYTLKIKWHDGEIDFYKEQIVIIP